MIIHNAYGVDLGTSQIKVFSQASGQTLTENNMIAIRNGTDVIAVGNDAWEMYERTPANIEVAQPVRGGRIADVAQVEYVMRTMLRRIDKQTGYAPIVYFSVPVNMSEIEKRAYYAMSHAGYLRSPKVFLVDRAICDAVAMGIPLSKTRGSMIVNMGGESTGISVIANEQVIISKDIPIVGRQLNEAICDMIRRQENLLVGHRTAKRLKAVIATLGEDIHEERSVFGMDTLSGLPREASVTSGIVCRAVRGQMSQLAEEIRIFLERTPPQICDSVNRDGIYLSGGTARIPYVDRYLKKHIGCNVNLPNYYEMCTIRGLEEIIRHKALHKWAYTIGKKK